jgi:hypothetical protein
MKKVLAVFAVLALIFAFSAGVLAADVTGKVEKADSGYVIKAADATYTVAGKVDMAPFVGKDVKATGEVKDKTITVEKVEEVK